MNNTGERVRRGKNSYKDEPTAVTDEKMMIFIIDSPDCISRYSTLLFRRKLISSTMATLNCVSCAHKNNTKGSAYADVDVCFGFCRFHFERIRLDTCTIRIYHILCACNNKIITKSCSLRLFSEKGLVDSAFRILFITYIYNYILDKIV